MGHKQIRTAQLVAPFGPGSLYTDRKGIPHVLCGLDFWHTRWDDSRGVVKCEKVDEFVRNEPRLTQLLRVDHFRIPPDFRQGRRGEVPPPNSGLYVPALRFPRWYRDSKTGRLRKFNLESKQIESPSSGGRWLPVRFVAVCQSGHMCEFPWKAWAECTCRGDSSLCLTDFGGSDLSSVSVHCEECGGARGKRKSLSGTTKLPKGDEQSAFELAGIACPGERPWLGDGSSELCRSPLVGALINQTNLYFSRTLSAIRIPQGRTVDADQADLRQTVRDLRELAAARALWDLDARPVAVSAVRAALESLGIDASPKAIEEALEDLFSDASAVRGTAPQPALAESDLLKFRRAEYDIIREPLDDPRIERDLRVVAVAVPERLAPWVSRVNLVERLKETRAFYGFTRLDPDRGLPTGLPDSVLNQLYRDPPRASGTRWLPAVEVFGEGIYIELSSDAIGGWMASNTDWLSNRLSDAFVVRVADRFQTMAPSPATRSWAARYLLVHSLAHILINQMIFECGYSSASLRERLYVSDDPAAPMAGILIYTSAGDSEGTLGGLVRLGRPERLEPVLLRALARASWCSADPVCSENLGGQGSQLANLAACHSCILLPETACETINHALDRAMVVGTPDSRAHGAFSWLLKNSVAIE